MLERLDRSTRRSIRRGSGWRRWPSPPLIRFLRYCAFFAEMGAKAVSSVNSPHTAASSTPAMRFSISSVNRGNTTSSRCLRLPVASLYEFASIAVPTIVFLRGCNFFQRASCRHDRFLKCLVKPNGNLVPKVVVGVRLIVAWGAWCAVPWHTCHWVTQSVQIIIAKQGSSLFVKQFGELFEVTFVGAEGLSRYRVAAAQTCHERSNQAASCHSLPCPHSAASKLAKCLTGDEVALDVEGVEDGGMG